MEFGFVAIWIWISLFSCTFPLGTDVSDVGIIRNSLEESVKMEKAVSGSTWITDQLENLLTGLREFSVTAFKSTGSSGSHDMIRSAEKTTPLTPGAKMIHQVNGLLTNLQNFTSAEYIFTTSTAAIREDVIMACDRLQIVSDRVFKTLIALERTHWLTVLSSITTMVMLFREIAIESNRRDFIAEMKRNSIRKKEEMKELLSSCKMVKYEKRKKTKQAKDNTTPNRPCINMRVTDIIPRFTIEHLEKVAKLRHYQMGAFILPSRLILGLAAMSIDTPNEVKQNAILQQYNVYKQRKNSKWINDLRNLAVGMMSRDWIDSNIVAI